MLESFRARSIYAVGYGRDPSIQALIADQVRLKGEERKKAASRIDAAASSSREAEALKAFVELAARPNELVIAKSTYFQEQSILRIRGVACVRGDVGFQPDLGHTVSVTWSDPVDVRLSNKSFNKLAGTLAALPLAEALDVLGSDEVSVSERKREEGIQPEQHVILDPLPVQPDLPKNLILYGPPGTGKTWRVLEKIGPSFGDRVELVTFHPNFAYEEFVEGPAPAHRRRHQPRTI